ncbi:EAL domain-containing protein [Vibrio sp. A1-b2]|uniref:EAL domain-containing protein n=1 Tax=Vibrio sp. A1-b2 TaxID=2912248 RepID=UPI001F41AB62|nr:EAL domain-containing protein [Vibrio sp. A1-b2]MCF7361106.1 EAL domain-containing protein [Vibrio sp. A1-b2]
MNSEKTIKHHIYVLGLSLILLTLFAKYNYDSLDVVEEVSAEVNNIIFENIKYYEDEISGSLPVKNCWNFLEENATLLLNNRNIRSISITDNKKVVCSSINLLNGMELNFTKEETGKIRFFYISKTPYSDSINQKNMEAFLIKISYTPTYSTIIGLYPESLTEVIDDYSEYDVYVNFENVVLYKDKIVGKNNALEGKSLYEVKYNISPYLFFKYVIINHSFVIIFWTLLYLLIVRVKSPIFDKFTISYWDINKAIKLRHFHPYLQPVFDINGTLTGAEVLVRWIHPTKGVIPPASFIEEVEANGKIREITQILMQKCSTYLRNVEFTRKGGFHLGFNVCAIQFDSNLLYEDIVLLQKELSSKPILIVLEITERQEFESKLFSSYINKLKDKNIKIALDDFGTGHCSMKYLINSSIDIIKIDRTFVNTISEGPNTHVLDAIINLANATNTEILAEGVENKEQFEYLYANNVMHYQGFYFDEPMPIEEFIGKYLS